MFRVPWLSWRVDEEFAEKSLDEHTGIFCRILGHFELVPGLLAGAIDFGHELAYILVKTGGVEMKDFVKKGLALALGMAVASREQIEKVVDELVKKGEVSASESKNLVDELIKKGEEEHQAMRARMREHMKEHLRELEVPSHEDVKNLQSRVEDLISRLEKLENRD